MTNKQLTEKIAEFDLQAEFDEESTEFLNVIVSPEQLHPLAKYLREDPTTQFDFLFCLTAVDWKTHLMIVYHLRSTELNHQVVVKVKLTDRENPVVDTVSDIWRTADFHEREAYDLMGIRFANHPDLRRIFLDDDWLGHPLRKDYTDEVNIVEL